MTKIKKKTASSGKSADTHLKPWLKRNLASGKFQATSLILTVLGDTISPHGGAFWLSDLIRLMAPFGIKERLIRTAVFRLTKRGWLSNRLIGRKSYYELTDFARQNIKESSQRIYNLHHPEDAATWCMIVLADMATAERDQIRRELIDNGFALLSNNVYTHPTVDVQSASDRLSELGVLDDCLIMNTDIHSMNDKATILSFLKHWWDIDTLEKRYKAYLKRFEPIQQQLSALPPPGMEQSFVLRTLLIHEYRQITLVNPQLPDEWISPSWSGALAAKVTKDLYWTLNKPALKQIRQYITTIDGKSPPTASYYQKRFSGIR